ncbi:MAG: HAD family hydrolase [Phycisphaerales bacterium]|nr:MAG: HAD family hydrolase [Phycisphaerales bacterium]
MPDRAVFLDRDDTLIEDPGYLNDPSQVRLLDGVPEALAELKALGYKLIVVSNQSAVARGIVTEKVLGKIHERLEQLLSERGAFLDRIYYCPYHTDGVIPKYTRDSDLRKPNPGMLLAAAEQMDIDLSRSWCVGNGYCDVEAGSRAGCKTILITHSSTPGRPQAGQASPDYTAVNLKEAVNIVKRHGRSPRAESVQTQSPDVSPDEPNAPPGKDNYQEPEGVSGVAEQLPSSGAAEPQTPTQEDVVPGDRTEQLLGGILEELRRMRRADMFGEFSVLRLMAGIIQIVVLFCLLATVWVLMNPDRQVNSAMIGLGFAVVLQLMALTFYMMEGRR